MNPILIRQIKNAIVSITTTVMACAAALGLVLLALRLAGYPPLGILHRWIIGSVGRMYYISNSLAETCPLLLTGLAAGIAFRCGVLNIGAQGQFLVGAMVATGLATRWRIVSAPWAVMMLAVFGGILAGGLWAALASLLDRRRGVPIVLSTILLNFIALYAVQTILDGPLQAHGTSAPQSPEVQGAFWLPVLIKFSSLHIGIIFAFALAILMYVVNRQTPFGFQTLVSGLNPRAAKRAGIPVESRQFMTMFLSGCFAGLGGAFQVLGVTHFMTADFGNYGYAGIAVALLGRLNPIGIAFSALFFGLLDTGALRVEESSLGLPHNIANVVKGVVVLVMLLLIAFMQRRRLASIVSDSGGTSRGAGNLPESAAVSNETATTLPAPLDSPGPSAKGAD